MATTNNRTKKNIVQVVKSQKLFSIYPNFKEVTSTCQQGACAKWFAVQLLKLDTLQIT